MAKGARGGKRTVGVSGGSTLGGTKAERDFVEDIARAMTNVGNDLDDIPMSRGDMQGAVEAFAMVHGSDEEMLIKAIENRADEIERGLQGQNGKSAILNNSFANEVYDIPYTMAFPSSKSVVNNVPELKRLKNAVDAAPIGAVVSFHIGGGDRHEDTAVFEKVSSKVWTETGLRSKNGKVEQYGGVSRHQGSNLLKAMADKKERSYYADNKAEFTKAYEEAYKKTKKK